MNKGKIFTDKGIQERKRGKLGGRMGNTSSESGGKILSF